MNIADSTGETSCKRQENGDAATGSERPLKKARFAWQVKGKYHLKNELSENSKCSSVPTLEPDRAGSSTENDSTCNDMGTEQNLEILGDYLLKQDFNTLDSVITDSNKSLLQPSTSISMEKLSYPRYVSSYEHNTNSVLNSSSDSNDCLSSISMVNIHNYTEDQCIARWQARQMAKGFVDNTINRVLDSWIQVPLPIIEDNSRYLPWNALDVAEFINNLPGDNSIENEGILMAISAHGLQNTSSTSSNSASQHTSNTCQSPQISPLHSEDESCEPLTETNPEPSSEATTDNMDIPWSYPDAKDADNDLPSFSLFPESSLSYQYFTDNNLPNSNGINDENMSENHCDFLDAAVMFAIQNKGLTTFSSEYG